MVENLDAVGLHGLADYTVGHLLPYIVVSAHPAQASFPESGPFRKVVVKKMYAGILRMFPNPRLYGVAVAFSR